MVLSKKHPFKVVFFFIEMANKSCVITTKISISYLDKDKTI